MMPLPELQAAFRADILRDTASLAALVLADGLAPESRLRIYRNNSFISLTEALKATFPVVCRLVDERFFGFTCHAYIAAHPPRAPCLAEYGADFADFLAAFPPAATLAYLPDMARFEWALNESYHASDAKPLDPARIAAVPAERQAQIRFALHPAVRLFRSRFPIDRIWEANREGAGNGAIINLDSGGCEVMIYRVGTEVRYKALRRGAFAFLSAFAEGAALEAACVAGSATDPSFELAQTLTDCLVGGFFSDFEVPAPARRG